MPCGEFLTDQDTHVSGTSRRSALRAAGVRASSDIVCCKLCSIMLPLWPAILVSFCRPRPNSITWQISNEITHFTNTFIPPRLELRVRQDLSKPATKNAAPGAIRHRFSLEAVLCIILEHTNTDCGIAAVVVCLGAVLLPLALSPRGVTLRISGVVNPDHLYSRFGATSRKSFDVVHRACWLH